MRNSSSHARINTARSVCKGHVLSIDVHDLPVISSFWICKVALAMNLVTAIRSIFARSNLPDIVWGISRAKNNSRKSRGLCVCKV